MQLRNTYYLMRHGEAVNNVLHILSDSKTRYPLTPKGRRQAEKAGKQLRRAGISYIYVSPVRRTRETSRMVLKHLKVPVRVEPDLREVGLGDFNDKSVLAFEAQFRSFFDRFRRRPHAGETYTEIEARVVRAIMRIDKRHKGRKILIISHGDPLWLLESALARRSRLASIARRYATYYRKGEVRLVVPHGSRYRFQSITNGRGSNDSHG